MAELKKPEQKKPELKKPELEKPELEKPEGKLAEWTKLSGPVLVALFCALVLTITDLTTRSQIAANQRAHDQRALQELLHNTLPDAMLLEAVWQNDQLTWCTRHVVVSRLKADGYAGPIELLLAWHSQRAEIIGITVVRHLETPGIADFLNDRQQTSWLAEFRTRTADEVERIDTVTGATISSSAIKRAVGKALQLTDSIDIGCSP